MAESPATAASSAPAPCRLDLLLHYTKLAARAAAAAHCSDVDGCDDCCDIVPAVVRALLPYLAAPPAEAEVTATLRYAEARARGLSDYEAREEGWPSPTPKADGGAS